MGLHASDFWTRHGKVSRAKYAIIGVVLFAIKHNLDRLIAAAYGVPWGFFNYWTYEPPAIGAEGTTSLATFYATLVLIALPFIWVGVVLTLRRLRDAALPLWLVFIFFLPFMNLFFFLVLCILPSATHESSRPFFGSRFRATLARIIPDSQVGSAALGVLITAILSVVLIVSSLNQLESYGWGLFVLSRNKVVADVVEQCVAIGELHHAVNAALMTRNNVHAELGEVIAGLKQGRTSVNEIIVFDSTGIALQDVVTAAAVFEKAIKDGVGTYIDFAP